MFGSRVGGQDLRGVGREGLCGKLSRRPKGHQDKQAEKRFGGGMYYHGIIHLFTSAATPGLDIS